MSNPVFDFNVLGTEISMSIQLAIPIELPLWHSPPRVVLSLSLEKLPDLHTFGSLKLDAAFSRESKS